MPKLTSKSLYTALTSLALSVTGQTGSAAAPDLSRLSVAQGFTIEVLADDVPNARQMALSNGGTLYVGTRKAGNVYAIPDALSKPQPAQVILESLNMPSGLAMHQNDLYVGAVSQVIRVPEVDTQIASRSATGDSKTLRTSLVTDQLPGERHHGWKYLGFGPDGKLYVPVGAPCNICLSEDPRFASILTMDINTGATALHAHGIRNTVGFDWHPETGELWFTDNGRDMLGDDVPAEELNRITRTGAHYGYPFVHDGTIKDPEFGNDSDPAAFVAPELSIQAHSAALGIAFHDGNGVPEQYRNAVFIAEHGSWNRSSKVGYRISVALETEAGLEYRPFIEGWLEGQDNWGRPNDVLIAPDGSLLIADDQVGAIYRVRFDSAQAAAVTLQ
ncbi:MAG: sorbosone dehydrogenase family protein [Pseudomonadales bacterium]